LTPVSPAITSNNVEFANLKNLDDIIKKLTNRLCKPEDLLISRGAESDSIYFISKGIIEIYIDDPRQGKVEDEYFELDQGQIFGEIGVILNTKRSAYARAQDYGILEELSQKSYKIIC
jgi:CRP-like cAMP-binding protein